MVVPSWRVRSVKSGEMREKCGRNAGEMREGQAPEMPYLFRFFFFTGMAVIFPRPASMPRESRSDCAFT
jgi:hypothetical protein